IYRSLIRLAQSTIQQKMTTTIFVHVPLPNKFIFLCTEDPQIKFRWTMEVNGPTNGGFYPCLNAPSSTTN
ncbi:hypothetical protein BLOT_005775, partial [Blomia tropicalis]